MNILIVRVGAMGDVLHALPAVAALKRARPQWRVDWAVDPRWVPLLVDDERGPMVDMVHLVPASEWSKAPISLATLRSVLGLRKELRTEHYDLAVDMQGTLRSAVIGCMAGADDFAGYADPRESFAASFYKRKIARRLDGIIRKQRDQSRAIMTDKLSHFDSSGNARMVDVSAKAATRREAIASAFVELSEAVLAALPENPKGNPLEVARFAGIQAAKRTSELIPMCHPLPLSFIDVEIEIVPGGIQILSTAATTAGTGVEMEALTAASIAALTIYDMTKALDKSIRIREIVLLEKRGGKSGDYRRNESK